MLQDISFKVQRAQNIIQRTSISQDSPWKLQQVQDAANHLQQAIHHIDDVDSSYHFRWDCFPMSISIVANLYDFQVVDCYLSIIIFYWLMWIVLLQVIGRSSTHFEQYFRRITTRPYKSGYTEEEANWWAYEKPKYGKPMSLPNCDSHDCWHHPPYLIRSIEIARTKSTRWSGY